MQKKLSLLKKFGAPLAIGCMALLAAQCGGGKAATATYQFAPMESDVAIAQSRWQGTTLNQLTQGYNLYSTKCTQCHGMKKMSDFSEADWPGIMQSMGRKAKLDSNEYNSVYHYILTRRQAILDIRTKG